MALHILMANFDNLSGIQFIPPMVAYVVVFVSVLALRLVQLGRTKDTDVDCVIARASLVPGRLECHRGGRRRLRAWRVIT